MNRARRRGIENEQKGPSCLDRNVKIIGRALSTGLQETMTTEGGRGAVPRMSPQPSIVPLLVVLVPLKDTVSQDAVEDKRALSRARIVHGLAARIFQESILYLPTLDSSKHPLPLGGGGSHPTSRILRLLGRNLGQFADVTYLMILEIVSINLSEF